MTPPSTVGSTIVSPSRDEEIMSAINYNQLSPVLFIILIPIREKMQQQQSEVRMIWQKGLNEYSEMSDPRILPIFQYRW
jgi:hypothetical protein